MSRYTNKKFFVLIFLLVVVAFSVPAFDLWQYPPSADKDSIFAGIFAANFAFDFQDPPSSEFTFDYPEFYLDYVLPVGLPFSFGLCFDSFRTDQYGIGIRPGYHINFDQPGLDVYLMYTLTFDISEDRMFLDHGPRIGFRYIFFDFVCVNIETRYRFEGLSFGLSIKLH